MEREMRSDIRFLRAYGVTTTTLLAVLALAAFQQSRRPSRFVEIDVERINVIEKGGQVRLIISNKERAPDGVIDGKTFKRQGGNSAGMIFYNDEGDENGGLLLAGETINGRPNAGAALLFDRYNQDQTVGIMYEEEDGRWASGLHAWDRPDAPLSAMIPRLDSLDSLSRAERTRAIQALRDRGLVGVRRVFVGRSDDSAATLRLYDRKGRPRLRLLVDATDSPRLEFLDERGRVTRTITGSAQPARR